MNKFFLLGQSFTNIKFVYYIPPENTRKMLIFWSFQGIIPSGKLARNVGKLARNGLIKRYETQKTCPNGS